MQSIVSEFNFKHDMRKLGWEHIFTKCRRIQNITDLQLSSFLEPHEDSTSGNEMLDRATQNGRDFSQEDAEWLLEHQKEIPKEWRSFYIVFPGTIWQDSNGRCYVPCLHWQEDGQWHLYFRWLGNSRWNNNRRLLYLRK